LSVGRLIFRDDGGEGLNLTKNGVFRDMMIRVLHFSVSKNWGRMRYPDFPGKGVKKHAKHEKNPTF
jgi:hypothetical protein